MEQPGGRLYRAFVVRWWHEAGVTPADPPVWRFILEEVGPPHTQRAFGTIEALMAFLHAEWRTGDGPTNEDNSGESPC